MTFLTPPISTPPDPRSPQSQDNPFIHPVKLHESGSEMGGGLRGSGGVLCFFIARDQQVRGNISEVTYLDPIGL